LLAKASEHYKYKFKLFHFVVVELHFIWPISVDLPGMVIG